jgi:hypothetical protein
MPDYYINDSNYFPSNIKTENLEKMFFLKKMFKNIFTRWRSPCFSVKLFVGAATLDPTTLYLMPPSIMAGL